MVKVVTEPPGKQPKLTHSDLVHSVNRNKFQFRSVINRWTPKQISMNVILLLEILTKQQAATSSEWGSVLNHDRHAEKETCVQIAPAIFRHKHMLFAVYLFVRLVSLQFFTVQLK